MAALIFYARGDNSTANNSALNVEGTTTTATATLEFQSTPGGDYTLDYNGGLADPDTVVLVNGVEMTFVVEFSGFLPGSNKLSNVNGNDLRGEEIVVITTSDGQRWFFLTNGTTSFATMDAFPNGAHAITGVDTTTNVVICFAAGTMILTPKGEVPVEALALGDEVLNAQGQTVRLKWVSQTRISGQQLFANPELRPIRIPAHSFGNGCPHSDLVVSPRHRILLDLPQNDLLFGTPLVLVAAKYLLESIATQECPAEGVIYYHLLFDAHEMLIANGQNAESYQPAEAVLNALGPQSRMDFQRTFTVTERAALMLRPDAYYSLKSYDAAALFKPRRSKAA